MHGHKNLDDFHNVAMKDMKIGFIKGELDRVYLGNMCLNVLIKRINMHVRV